MLSSDVIHIKGVVIQPSPGLWSPKTINHYGYHMLRLGFHHKLSLQVPSNKESQWKYFYDLSFYPIGQRHQNPLKQKNLLLFIHNNYYNFFQLEEIKQYFELKTFYIKYVTQHSNHGINYSYNKKIYPGQHWKSNFMDHFNNCVNAFISKTRIQKLFFEFSHACQGWICPLSTFVSYTITEIIEIKYLYRTPLSIYIG